MTRTYATKKKTAAPPPGEASEDVKRSDTTDDSKSAQSPQTEKKASLKAQKVKAEDGEKAVPKKKKKAPSPSKAGQDQTAPVTDQSNKTDETVKLWQETLDVLKDLQKTQDATEGPRSGRGNPIRKGGKNGDADTKRSLKSHFPPIPNAPSNKARERQAKLLEGTLDVLKSVLTVQADQRSKESKTDKTTKASSPASKPERKQTASKGEPAKPPSPTTKPERKQAASKGEKEEGRKLLPKKPGTSEAAVAQGFAALLRDAQEKKKAASQDGTSRPKSVERAPSAPKSLKKGDKTANADDVGWGSSKNKHRMIKKVKTKNTGLEPVHVHTAPVPHVQYDLDRVLFNEGVYVLQDPRTRVFNFDPYLATIMPVDEFDFEALKQYVTSSKDTTLIGVAKEHNKKFTGSTSSMTSTLAHFHYLLSAWRPINPERISKGYVPDSENFGAILRAPAATFLHYKDGTYAIDADKEYDSDTILSMLGKSMEKLLTAPKEEFEKYRRSNSHQLTEEERNADESYHYTTFGDFMMRSQLDAYDPRLPGTGVFDLKTRAVVSIRMDAKNHHKGVGYEIRQRQGQWESFEREYYDMIRLAFLKYSLQVRMGRMDGIFVAYHNTQRIFGFQYIPLEEMDLSLHGTTDLTIGNREFMTSLQLWEEMLKKATERFPERSLRIHVETRTSTVVPFMYFFAEPVNDDEIKAIQEQNKEEAEKFQERVLGIKPKPDPVADSARAELDEAEEASAEELDTAEDDVALKEETAEEAREAEDDGQEVNEEDSEDVWEDMMDVVEQKMESDAQGISAIRDAIEDALEQSGLLHARSSEEAEQYVEALLKSIVDVDAERSKADEAVTEVPKSENETPGEQTQAPNAHITERTDNVDQDDSSPPAPKPSRLGFLSRWFGSSSKEADATARQESASETEPDQSTSMSPEQDSTPKDDIAEPATAEGKAADEKVDDDLKDLLIKLTTRIGTSSDVQKATEELSEDQAKLRNFKSILLEMMPEGQETPAEAAAEEDRATSSDADKETVEDAPTPSGSEEPADKPVLGLVLTIRNNVNGKYVQRPEKLMSGDKWHVEYTIDELAEDRVQGVYEASKRRRRQAHYKDPGRDRFRTAFDGLLTHYSKAGREFRARETRLARNLPLRFVGDDQRRKDLFIRKTAEEKKKLQEMAKEKKAQETAEEKKLRAEVAIQKLQAEGKTPLSLLDGQVHPSATAIQALEARKRRECEIRERKTPFGWVDGGRAHPSATSIQAYEAAKARQGESGTKMEVKQFPTQRRLSLKDDIATTEKSLVADKTVVEEAEKGSTSFREWREKTQPKQDRDKEQEQEQEKEKGS